MGKCHQSVHQHSCEKQKCEISVSGQTILFSSSLALYNLPAHLAESQCGYEKNGELICTERETLTLVCKKLPLNSSTPAHPREFVFSPKKTAENLVHHN